MYLKSHKWILEPYTAYEICRELRVRESRHTVRLYDKKYLDIDTGKFNADKLQSIYSSSLTEMTSPRRYGLDDYGDIPPKYEKWFTPKDDDFE